MYKIEFFASYGNENKRVEIAQSYGGGDHYQILIDRYYHGIITKRKGEWVAFLNSKSELTGDDVLIIGELIEKTFLG
jgi:hypothetical protein